MNQSVQLCPLLVSSQVQQYGVRYRHRLIFDQDDVIGVQVRLLPLFHLKKGENVRTFVKDESIRFYFSRVLIMIVPVTFLWLTAEAHSYTSGNKIPYH